MRKLLLAGLAGMIMAGPALADPRDHDGRGWDRGQDGRGNWRGDDRRGDGWRGHEGRDFDRRGNDWRWDGARYRGPAFIHPQGYAYRPWGPGYRLPPAYFSSRYYIGNPGYYRLPPAYVGTRWIRVGPDALLIRIGDGIILRAVRGLYW